MENDASYTAPFADTMIPLYLSSTTGMKHRIMNCMECGREFLERDGDHLYRLNDDSQPREIAIGDGIPIAVTCGNCQQLYSPRVSITVVYERDGIPLYLQPQSVYIVSEPKKRLRYIHCLECGKPFQTISDRVAQMVDNRIPFEMVNPARLGPIEAICSFNKCHQAWAIMV